LLTPEEDAAAAKVAVIVSVRPEMRDCSTKLFPIHEDDVIKVFFAEPKEPARAV
jgi:hypothetical protein